MVAVRNQNRWSFKKAVPRENKKRWRIHWKFRESFSCGTSSVLYVYKDAYDLCVELMKRYPGMELTPVLEIK